MERDVLIIRNFALDLVKEVQHMSCSFDRSENIQRTGTALHLYFSELFEVAGNKETDALVENALRTATEFCSLLRFENVSAISLEKMELLVFTLRTYRSVDGKLRKFARHNTGGINF